MTQEERRTYALTRELLNKDYSDAHGGSAA